METQISLGKGDENKQIFDLIFTQDELTWQSMIHELVSTEQMDPWNVDISKLANKFLEMLKKLKETNFRVTGKMVLACAILLKIKSKKLLSEDIVAFDNLMSSSEEYDLLEELESLTENPEAVEKKDEPVLYPRIPQPRKRKVSVHDLVNALEKALEVDERRKHFIRPKHAVVEPPKKTKDITLILDEIYETVAAHFETNETQLTFMDIIPSDSKQDKVLTFMPLLHLENSRRVDLMQKKHFGDIFIELAKKAK
jgi:segregation and condensation protein A